MTLGVAADSASTIVLADAFTTGDEIGIAYFIKFALSSLLVLCLLVL